MKKLLLIILIIPIFFSCRKDDTPPEPEVKKLLKWDTVYSASGLDFRQEFFVLDNNTGGLAVNTPTTVKILMTTDGGINWSETDTKLTALEVRSVAFQTREVGYISLFGKGVFKTEDGGDNWTQIKECTCALTASSNSVSIIDGYKTYYSTDRGASFTEQEVDFPLLQNPFSSFRFGDNVYLYFLEGLIKSDDGGISWKNTNLNFSTISSITPVNSSKWYLISNNTLLSLKMPETNGHSLVMNLTNIFRQLKTIP